MLHTDTCFGAQSHDAGDRAEPRPRRQAQRCPGEGALCVRSSPGACGRLCASALPLPSVLGLAVSLHLGTEHRVPTRPCLWRSASLNLQPFTKPLNKGHSLSETSSYEDTVGRKCANEKQPSIPRSLSREMQGGGEEWGLSEMPAV